MKIGFLIPCTSKNRNWNDFNDIYLHIFTLKSFLWSHDEEHEYTFYIGIDHDDPIFTNPYIIPQFRKFLRSHKHVNIEFTYFEDISKGHLTKMWNVLCKEAYDDGCAYFFQCGDDISFETKGWVNACIDVLQKNNNIGVTSPVCKNNQLILTQTFVSRKHVDIFGFYFPEEIVNWGCDDWMNIVYQPNHFFPLHTHLCNNLGGQPRYVIDNNEQFINQFQKNVQDLRQKTRELVDTTHKPILNGYIRLKHL